MTSPVSCGLCGAAESKLLYRLPAGGIRRCGSCAVVFRENPISGVAAATLYEDDAYLDAPYFEALKVGHRRDVEPYLVYRRALERLERLTPGRQLLDVGCSYGAFLEVARERGWEVSGVELSRKGSEYARKHRGLEVFTGTLEDAGFPDGAFDAVSLWDVVEHLDRPLELLRKTHRILRPGGVLVVFTINQRSLINATGDLLHRVSLGAVRGPLVLLYDIHHNFFFDTATLGGLTRRAGFNGGFEWDRLAANIDRWQNVPIPPLLALGSKCLDRVARLTGRDYRLILFARKETS
jgi:SAM-dependent methyltransferase